MSTPTIPTPSGTTTVQLFNLYLQRIKDDGEQQRVLADGFYENNITQWKSGKSPIPMGRMLKLSEGLGLSATERHEFITTRLLELHGYKNVLCLDTVVTWGSEVFGPTGQEAKLIELLNRAIAPAPGMLFDLLDDPSVAGEVFEVIERAAQRRLQQASDDSKHP